MNVVFLIYYPDASIAGPRPGAVARPPEDPLRYHAALVLSVDLGRDVLRQQYQAFRDAAQRREELARLVMAVTGGALGFAGLAAGPASEIWSVALFPFSVGSALSLVALMILGGTSDVTRWKEGPSLEAVAAEARDPTWSDDRLLLSLVHAYPVIRRKNAQMLERASRQRGAAFVLFTLAILAYLSAGSYILWSLIHG